MGIIGSACSKCGSVGESVDGVCIHCLWNTPAEREATEEEADNVLVKFDNAVADLEVFLGRDYCSDEDPMEV